MKPKAEISFTRHGGIIPIIREMVRRGLPELIDSTYAEILPRKHNAVYKLSDMFVGWFAAAMCGAKRIHQIEDLTESLEAIPGLKIPSHDTIGRLMKDLATPIQHTDRINAYTVTPNEWDDNVQLNRLLIQASKLMGALKTNKKYTLDVDCTFIHTRNLGAKSVKKKDAPGFYPMICLIDDMPVFISMRNGNSSADFRITETIELCLNLLDEAGIKIQKVRTDGAAYRKELVHMLAERNTEFVTGTPANSHFKRMFRDLDAASWNTTTIETANSFKECQIAEIIYCMSARKTPFRIIALKVPTEARLRSQLNEEELEHREYSQKRMAQHKKNGKLKSSNRRYREGDWNTVRDFSYKLIMTNDFTSKAEDLIYFYNDRGTSETKFSFLKQDFAWRLPPYQWLNQNSVFFIISGMANNIFRGLAEHFNEYTGLELNARVEKFRKRFIDFGATCLSGEWTFHTKKINFAKIA